MIHHKAVSVSFSVPVRFILNSSENLNGIYILPWKQNTDSNGNKQR
jgi:hypothetical protein